MLIVNDEQRHLAGAVSLEERCKYCSKAFAEYPLIDQDCPNDRQQQSPIPVVQCWETGAAITSHAAFARGSRASCISAGCRVLNQMRTNSRLGPIMSGR